MKNQIWNEDDPNLSVNDIVYFKLGESPLKSDLRVGKVDSVQLSRDGKVRQVNIAYKIFKEEGNTWSHNVVTRPVRELVKLYEVGDTTFAQDMALVRKTALEILAKRGASKEIGVGTVDEQISSSNDDNNLDVLDYFDPQKGEHLPFVNCVSYQSWDKGADSCAWSELDSTKKNDLQFDNDFPYDNLVDDEIIFLI